MWDIIEHRRIDGQLEKVPIDVLKRYEVWKGIAQMSGPQGLRRIRGFRDETLKGKWNGHRSSRLNQQYRIIYKVEKEKVLIKVVEVTAHNYRKR